MHCLMLLFRALWFCRLRFGLPAKIFAACLNLDVGYYPSTGLGVFWAMFLEEFSRDSFVVFEVLWSGLGGPFILKGVFLRSDSRYRPPVEARSCWASMVGLTPWNSEWKHMETWTNTLKHIGQTPELMTSVAFFWPSPCITIYPHLSSKFPLYVETKCNLQLEVSTVMSAKTYPKTYKMQYL